ncbi:MAG TPA: hypothetical protein VKU19_42360 [Bryobacteraceae bacterium]|nr:hypothetical protein [Bryobacteraceae bacterium]
MIGSRLLTWTAVGLTAAGLGVLTPVFAAAGNCAREPMPNVSSSEMPADVCIPHNFTDVATDYFDDYSWRAFVALMWPAAAAHRGLPDTVKKLADGGPRVFETYKSLWEVFHQDGSEPDANFDGYDSPGHNACAAKIGFGDAVIASFSGLDELAQFGPGEMLGPLAAQNGRYIRTETSYNQAAYDYIVKHKLYLRSALPEVPSPRPAEPVLQFPDGSVVLKSAWVDLNGFTDAQKRRYYSRKVTLRDANTGKCSVVTMGLLGMHIVQKTATRPQWIWSTFEHVDNTPPARPGAPGLFALHNGGADLTPAENPLVLVPLAKEPVKPYNVTRSPVSPIHPKTAYTNLMYERQLRGTIWENYQLVMTQWPRVEGEQSVPVPASLSGDASHTFPGLGSASGSAFANVTMETFDQERPQLGCMNCHNRARLAADFLWSVLDHAYPPNLAPAAKRQ